MTSHQEAKRRAAAYLRAEGSPLAVSSAIRDRRFGVWVIGYRDPYRPDEMLDGGGLVVTDAGDVHVLGSAPGSLDNLMLALGRPPTVYVDDVYAREGEGLALLADLDRDEAEGLVARAAARRPWPGVLGEEMDKPYFRALLQFVDRERAKHEVYPEPHDMFEAFHLTDYEQLKVIILGQDPYPQPGRANGLCFSVPHGVSKPTSLRNIHSAMRHDGITPPEHGDLTAWAQQGVLLLNTALTVRLADPGSHAKEWREFTDAVIRLLNAREESLVFVLWGQAAQRKGLLVDADRHAVIQAPHPAARGAAQARFRESQTFSKVNRRLREWGQEPIKWAIP